MLGGFKGLVGLGAAMPPNLATAPAMVRLPQPRRLLVASMLIITALAAAAFGSILYSINAMDGAAVRSEIVRAEVALRAVITEASAPTANLATRFSKEYQLQRSHFTKAESPLAGGEVSVPVPGMPGTMLAWTPRRFASDVFVQLAPIRVLGTVLLLAGIGVVLRRQYRLAVELDAQRRAIAELAAHDALTGLANRLAFDEHLSSATPGTALLYIDLDGFKQVNDRFGHGVGDALLKVVGARLVAVAGRNDFVARIGGDEFALVRGVGTSREDLAEIASDIAAVLSEPVHLGEDTLHVAASIGIAVTDRSATDAGGLVRAADVALYRAKALPGHSFVFAEPAEVAAAA